MLALGSILETAIHPNRKRLALFRSQRSIAQNPHPHTGAERANSAPMRDEEPVTLDVAGYPLTSQPDIDTPSGCELLLPPGIDYSPPARGT
jgi:hypothetical protein